MYDESKHIEYKEFTLPSPLDNPPFDAHKLITLSALKNYIKPYKLIKTI
jgi:hypothetical protein